MKLTDYYLFKEIKQVKSHRFDRVASTGGYEPLENLCKTGRDKVSRLYFYYGGVPDSFNANAKRKAERTISNGDNITSVYIPDLDNQLMGYGDMIHTNDALLFLFSEDYKQIEMFVARGMKNNARQLYYLFADGELTEEIEQLRQQAKPDSAANL